MDKKVFISYSREDKNKVFKIKDEIEQHIGNECWIDLTGIESDKEFSDVIISAINQCEVFVFMYSTKSSVSPWTKKELNFAEKKKKRIVFVNIDNSELADWFLFNYSNHDIISYSKKEQMEKLLRDMESWFGKASNPPITLQKNNKTLYLVVIGVLVLSVLIIKLLYTLTNISVGPITSNDSISVKSDAMLVDLSLLELAQTKNGIENKLIQYQSYSASYNHTWKLPNWVAYSLDSIKQRGNVRRATQFSTEPLLKDDSVTTNDYRGSGYDRGHMAPAGDMKWSETSMKDCFYLCNICPQTSALNSGLWHKLESRVRCWAKKDTIYVCCGPIVLDNHKKINNKIAIPDSFFKVICKKSKGGWTSIGFVFPNSDNLNSDNIYSYAMSVDDIEKLTGHDFFYNIPKAIQDKMERTFSKEDW